MYMYDVVIHFGLYVLVSFVVLVNYAYTYDHFAANIKVNEITHIVENQEMVNCSKGESVFQSWQCKYINFAESDCNSVLEKTKI